MARVDGGDGVLAILCYHSVVAGPVSRRYRRFAVPRTLLDEQLAAVCEAGYQLRSVAQAVAAEGKAAPGAVGLSFDDGLADFGDHALPVVRGHAMGSTLFVPTAHVGQKASWLAGLGEGERRLLSWEALRDVAAEGVEIGGHGHEHRPLEMAAPSAMERDIRVGADTLATMLAVRPRSFCYPYGYSTRRCRRAVAAAGYSSACDVGYGVNRGSWDVYGLRRILVTPWMTPEEVVRQVRGGRGKPSDTARRLARVPVRGMLGVVSRRSPWTPWNPWNRIGSGQAAARA